MKDLQGAFHGSNWLVPQSEPNKPSFQDYIHIIDTNLTQKTHHMNSRFIDKRMERMKVAAMKANINKNHSSCPSLIHFMHEPRPLGNKVFKVI